VFILFVRTELLLPHTVVLEALQTGKEAVCQLNSPIKIPLKYVTVCIPHNGGVITLRSYRPPNLFGIIMVISGRGNLLLRKHHLSSQMLLLSANA